VVNSCNVCYLSVVSYCCTTANDQWEGNIQGFLEEQFHWTKLRKSEQGYSFLAIIMEVLDSNLGPVIWNEAFSCLYLALNK
jgi:hypothetical protein